MNADGEEYDEFLNDLKIKQTVQKDEIETKIGVKRTRLEHLVNVLKDILNRIRRRNSILGLESVEFVI